MTGTSKEGRIRLLGLDYGDKSVGVAISDGFGCGAEGVCVIRRERASKLRETYRRIGELIEDYGIGGIVVGLPMLLDGSEGERCVKTREFAKNLSDRCGLPVFFQDEEFSTDEAYRLMDERGIKKEQQKLMVDEVAALLILEDYLETHGTDNI